MHHLTLTCEQAPYINVSDQHGNITKLLAWDISQHFSDVGSIKAVSFLELLSTMEADAALIDWVECLAVGGTISILGKDSDYYAQLWLDADWNETTLTEAGSAARMAFKGLWGGQTGSNPKLDGYDQHYYQVQKSAYNTRRLGFLLARVGFAEIEVTASDGELLATATKSMRRGERQIAPNISAIRDDHKNRYDFAAGYLAKQGVTSVLDIACGIGYGSQMLHNLTGASVVGVDIDQGAVDYAKQHYADTDIEYHCCDALEFTIATKPSALVSFETIEHVDFDQALMAKFNSLLDIGGWLICSTPNEKVMPFDPVQFKYHIKHYEVEEFTQLATGSGFEVVEIYTQIEPVKGVIEKGEHGCFTILVCRKAEDVPAR